MTPGKPVPRVTEVTRPYWEAAGRGALLLQRCSACRRFIHYPRPWCPACWGTALSWVEASGQGRIVTFTVVHQAPFPSYAGDVPYVLAVVGLAEGPQMMANIVGCDPARVGIDDPVEVTFEERRDDQGRGFRVPQFRLSEGEDPESEESGHG